MKSEACDGREIVVVANSRSARTALPSEQTQPGRRFEQAAHPTVDKRFAGFCLTCAISKFPASAIVLPRSPACATRSDLKFPRSLRRARKIFRPVQGD